MTTPEYESWSIGHLHYHIFTRRKEWFDNSWRHHSPLPLICSDACVISTLDHFIHTIVFVNRVCNIFIIFFTDFTMIEGWFKPSTQLLHFEEVTFRVRVKVLSYPWEEDLSFIGNLGSEPFRLLAIVWQSCHVSAISSIQAQINIFLKSSLLTES